MEGVIAWVTEFSYHFFFFVSADRHSLVALQDKGIVLFPSSEENILRVAIWGCGKVGDIGQNKMQLLYLVCEVLKFTEKERTGSKETRRFIWSNNKVS